MNDTAGASERPVGKVKTQLCARAAQPERETLGPLLRVSSALLFRVGLWNAVMLLRVRAAQAMDTSGVAAAAYSISLQARARILCGCSFHASRVRPAGGVKVELGVADCVLFLTRRPRGWRHSHRGRPAYVCFPPSLTRVVV